MALNESALSELLCVLRAADGVDLVRQLAQCTLQELIRGRGYRTDRSPLRRPTSY